MTLDADLPELDGAEAATEPRPIIVLQRRPRIWSAIFPPALILAVACGVLCFRLQTPDWRGLSPLPHTAPIKASAASSDLVAAEPVTAEARDGSPEQAKSGEGSESMAQEASPPAEEPETVAATPAVEVELDPFEPVPGDPDRAPAESASVNPDVPEEMLYRPLLADAPNPGMPQGPDEGSEDAEVDAREVWDDIQGEAEKKREERERLQGLKAAIHRHDEQESARKREERVQSERARRVEFLRDLQRLVRGRPEEAGPEIRRLAERGPGGGFLAGGMGADLTMSLVNSASRRRALVARRRAEGASEPMILAELQAVHMRNSVSRNGPRDADQAIVRAALDLLAVPLNATAPPEDTAAVRAALPPPIPMPARGNPPSSRFGPSRRR